MQAAELTSGGVRVVFRRRDDRFGHEIHWATDPGGEPLLVSVEGPTGEPWPHSPPFQQLHTQRRSGPAVVVLMVGMAGGNHYSGTVEATSDGIVFDMACRIHGPPGWLGSTYSMAGDVVCGEGTAGDCLLLQQRDARIHLELDRTDGKEASLLPLSPQQVAVSAGARTQSGPTTVRWRYSLHRAG